MHLTITFQIKFFLKIYFSNNKQISFLFDRMFLNKYEYKLTVSIKQKICCLSYTMNFNSSFECRDSIFVVFFLKENIYFCQELFRVHKKKQKSRIYWTIQKSFYLKKIPVRFKRSMKIFFITKNFEIVFAHGNVFWRGIGRKVNDVFAITHFATELLCKIYSDFL